MSMLEKIANGFRGTIVAGALAATVACGGGSGPQPPTGPSNGTRPITIKAYNATEGHKGTFVKETDAQGKLNLTVQDVINVVNVGQVHPEIALRGDATAQKLLGELYSAGNTIAVTLPSTVSTVNAYLPNAANGAEYNCQPEPNLKFGRNVTVGERNDGATGPISIFTDKITEINNLLQSKGYGSVNFNSGAANSQFTVGFTINNRGGPAFFIPAQNAIYMLGREYKESTGFFMDYNRATTKDTALEELFETLTFPPGADDLCGKSAREKIGLGAITNGAQSGLSPAGVDYLTRAYTRASQ